MRISEINSILKENISSLTISTKKTDQKNYRITGLKKLLKAVSGLRSTGLFIEETEVVFSYLNNYQADYNDSVILNEKDHQEFQKKIGILNSVFTQSRRTTNELCRLNASSDISTSINIKLPDSYDLKKTGSYLVDLNLHLSQLLVNKYLNGDLKLTNFDRGSFWIEVALGSPAALSFFISLINYIYKCREREIDIKAQKIALEDMISEKKLRVQLRASLSKKIKNENEEDFMNLLVKYGIEANDNEYISRINNSTEKITEMLKDGLQVHPILEKTSKANDKLPDQTRLHNIMKQLALTKPEESDSTDSPASDVA